MSAPLSRPMSRRTLFKGIGLLGLTASLAGCSRQAAVSVKGLPSQTVWATYPTGTGTYNDVAAIANMITNRSGSKVRIMAGDTGIARVGPMIAGTAQYARAGDEYYYAFEGEDEFTTENWGPQPIRQIWAPPGNYGVLVRKDSGITKVSDLRGKRFPRLLASTSMNYKLEAILDFGGLTRDDVTLVDISYSEQAEAMKTGHLDVMYQNVVGATVEELASQYPIRWLDFSGGTPEQYRRWDELAPMVLLGEFSDGAGMGDGETVTNMQYSIPLTTTRDRPADEVRAMLELIHANFDDFKDSTPDAQWFAADKVLLAPAVPFHDGAVEFFRDIGRWTPALQERNEELIERERLMEDAWPDFWDRHADSDDAATKWKEWKSANLPSMTPVSEFAETQKA
ncbi:TAXI family TRAP transporter solute-binding subunit [Corynebacterium glyciniphilum]|uniref:TAXI family TRAP transporter solute-binding subunit n=1 Tax=Corynebacterium glyciniphilum TaxID=1404244 RepID=UPI003D9FF801